MTKIDVYSGFLGAGKTTLIRKMISEAYKGQKVVLIENEFGQIGIDGGFLKECGVEIREMNSGCICCSLVGDFGKALNQVIGQYHPDRVIIEPSGVGKLSDVVAAAKKATNEDVQMGYAIAVVDANKCKVYSRNFGEFYNNQLESAATIIMSRTDSMPQEKLDKSVAIVREHNPNAVLVTTPWDQLTGTQITEAMESSQTLAQQLAEMAVKAHEEHMRQHHHHDDEECCDHEHHHHDDEECCDHEHHHHDDEECCDHEHHHHHDEECCDHEHHHHDEECCCGHDHHHHHADEVFSSWGVETTRKFTMDGIRHALDELDSGEMGAVLRAKGIVAGEDGKWIHFDFVPGEVDLRNGPAATTGLLCVIGSKLDEAAIAKTFGV